MVERVASGVDVLAAPLLVVREGAELPPLLYDEVRAASIEEGFDPEASAVAAGSAGDEGDLRVDDAEPVRAVGQATVVDPEPGDDRGEVDSDG